MELKVEAGHNRLVQLMKFLRTNQSDLDEVVHSSVNLSLVKIDHLLQNIGA